MRTSLRVFTAPAIAGLVLLASAPGAQAAPTPVSEFDAPIFGTTATLTEGRMPTYAEVNCSDARCTSGVIIGAEGGSTAYISTTVARGGAFAESPGFVAKLNKNWAGLSGNYSEDFSTFTINLTQVLPGTDIAALVAADAETPPSGPRPGISTTPVGWCRMCPAATPLPAERVCSTAPSAIQ